MRFEYIVLLIIAFNVISALMQRRAKKAREAAGQSDPNADEEDWMEDDDEAREVARRRAPSQPASTSSRIPDEERVEKMPSLGRDILDQMMRDLGLKVPSPSSPQPPSSRPASSSPSPATSRPVPMSARSGATSSSSAERPVSQDDLGLQREQRERRERELAAESARAREQIKEWERLANSRSRNPERQAAASRQTLVTPRKQPTSVAAPMASSAANRVMDLRNPNRLREAFIVKEILDAPLSRRPRR
jgi:hypothetical protein